MYGGCGNTLLATLMIVLDGTIFIYASRSGICQGTFEVLWSILESHQTL